MPPTNPVPPEISIIVPSRGRADKLGVLAETLRHQTLDPDRFELVVALDGDHAELDADTLPYRLTVSRLPFVGISAAKNQAVAQSRGAILLFANDDIVPEPDWLTAHLAAHDAGEPVVLGDSPWARYDDQTIFDDLIAASRMIFFYPSLDAHERYNFRHAWNLNCSYDRTLLEAIKGPFCDELRPVYFDDIEMAFRVMRDQALVYFEPAARATHHHRYTPAQYFAREALLGVMAPALEFHSPDCYADLFPAPTEELAADAVEQINTTTPNHAHALENFVELVQRPSAHIDANPAAPPDDLYLAHVPLKRRAFRLGLLRAKAEPSTPWTDRVALGARAIQADPVFASLYPPAVGEPQALRA